MYFDVHRAIASIGYLPFDCFSSDHAEQTCSSLVSWSGRILSTVQLAPIQPTALKNPQTIISPIILVTSLELSLLFDHLIPLHSG